MIKAIKQLFSFNLFNKKNRKVYCTTSNDYYTAYHLHKIINLRNNRKYERPIGKISKRIYSIPEGDPGEEEEYTKEISDDFICCDQSKLKILNNLNLQLLNENLNNISTKTDSTTSSMSSPGSQRYAMSSPESQRYAMSPQSQLQQPEKEHNF